jgi:predicted ATPase/DNA-binding CsgD family transcriptional regulator
MFVAQITRQPGRLPVEVTGFVGREAELARLVGLLERARLVTVTGPGGVGKTRVALRAAALALAGGGAGGRRGSRFADGVRLVELAPLREPELLPDLVAEALGLPERPAGQQRDAVLAHLRDRRLLLILDTCEHLIDACAVFAEAAVAEAPGLTLLATSREPLDVIGENSCPIPPLPIPSLDAIDGQDTLDGTAVDLFMQRAAAAVPGFAVTAGDMRHVLRLCQRLDGIPLAIELATVRLRALPLAELARRLDERQVLLTSGQRGGRHKTLRDAIAWSYDLCTPAEQALWARLSVFAGPVSISAAEEVCADGALDRDQVMPTMIRLVDKSVLARTEPAADGGSGAAGQPTRYQMLAIIREFGAEQLSRTGAQDATRDRLRARYLAMARRFFDHFPDDDQLDRLRELGRDYASIKAVIESALDSDRRETVADGVKLATAMFAYWRARGLPEEGSYWLSKAVERAPAGSLDQVMAQLGRGYFAAMRGNGELALADSDDSLRIGTALGDDWIIAHGHLLRNLALTVSGRLAEAAEAGAEAGRRLTALGSPPRLIDLEIQLTYLALFNGDDEAAIAHVQRGLDLLGDRRERWLHGKLYLLAALALFLAVRDTESTWGATRSLRVKHEIGDTAGVAFAVELLGWLAVRSGSQDRAAWLLGGADHLWGQAGGRTTATGIMERLHQEAMAQAADALGDRRFEALFTRAARQPLDQLVAFAASDADDPAEGANPKSRPAGHLTVREHEIATLVGQGFSNRQIAERLFISRRTVDAHVEHIFDKMGITSRVMLALQLREQPVAASDNARA